jgi:hypothetical protein
MESFYGRISKNDGNCQTGRREGGIIHYPVRQYPYSISSTDVGFRETPLLSNKHQPGALKANQRQCKYDDVDDCQQTEQES